MSLTPPLILTLKLDLITFNQLDKLRQLHFPPERNFIPAHITLFHKLPGNEEMSIRQTLQNLCSQTQALPLSLPKLRSLGRGLAIEVESPELVSLRKQLAQEWATWLSPQDQQAYRPHVTIQNKVTPNQARQLYEQLSQVYEPFGGCGEGLLLWYYRDGPWEMVEEFAFAQLPS